MGPSDPDSTPGGLQSRRPRHRLAWRVAFVVSGVLHLALIYLYGGVSGPPTLQFSPGDEGSAELQGLELLNLVTRAEDEVQRPEEPDEELERVAIPVVPLTQRNRDREDVRPGARREAPREDFGPLGPTAAERLRVRVGDPRLWAPLGDPELGEPTLERYLESELLWRLAIWQDSAAARLRREEAITDWTFTDKEGNKWGVSPGKLHLGSITLPLPFNLGVNPGRYDDWMEQQFIDGELSRGAVQSLIYESRRERAEAMLERRDRERAEAQEELQRAGPRRTPPDTTRSGGGR